MPMALFFTLCSKLSNTWTQVRAAGLYEHICVTTAGHPTRRYSACPTHPHQVPTHNLTGLTVSCIKGRFLAIYLPHCFGWTASDCLHPRQKDPLKTDPSKMLPALSPSRAWHQAEHLKKLNANPTLTAKNGRSVRKRAFGLFLCHTPKHPVHGCDGRSRPPRALSLEGPSSRWAQDQRVSLLRGKPVFVLGVTFLFEGQRRNEPTGEFLQVFLLGGVG